jgi:prolyl oligopeptidase
MMRYHLFNIGYKYESEYGSVKDSLDFANLIRYSPVNNVREGVDYPATLLVASDNDDRVSPFHSFKFLSHLQAKGGKKNPYVLYYVEKAGHSGSRIFDDYIKTKAYVYSFIFKYLDMEKKIYFED